MKHPSRSLLPLFFITASLCLPASAFAMDLADQSKNVFRFQQKLAENGNEHAQYKLAMMYEAGVGVDQDIEQARHWYSEASEAGNKAATDRITFLEVKQHGYQQDKHAGWLEGVKNDASQDKTEAMVMLGQMYRKGIAVEKDLNRSLELLSEVNSSGEQNVDREILAIRSEIAASKMAELERQRKQALQEQQALNKSVAVQTTPGRVQPEQAAKARQESEAARKAAEEEKLLAEKKRRYEEVMAQIRLEQKMLREQQARVSDGVAIAVDEEF